MAMRQRPPGGGPMHTQQLRSARSSISGGHGCGVSANPPQQCSRRAVRCRQPRIACSAAGGDRPQDAISWMFNAGRRMLKLDKGGDPQQSESDRRQHDDSGAQLSQPTPDDEGALPQEAQPSGSSIVSSARQHSGEQPERFANSFESWREYIERMDGASLMTAELDQQLQQAVQLERFNEAQQIKQQLEEVIVEDVVGTSMAELDEMLDEERYEEAARLRDEAHVGMEGWWAGHGEDDPFGHLLFVSHGFGCYKGVAYLPRHLMEIRDMVNGGQLKDGDVDSMLMTMGHPLLEVFLRKEPPSNSLRHCATAIVPASGDGTFDYVDMSGSNGSGSGSDGSGELQDASSESSLSFQAGQVFGVAPDGQSADDSAVQEVLRGLQEEVMKQIQQAVEQHMGNLPTDPNDRDAYTDVKGASIFGEGGPNISNAELSEAIQNGGGTIDLGNGTLHVEVSAGDAAEMARGAADMRRFGRDRFAIQALKNAGDRPALEDDGGDDARVAALLGTDEEGLALAAQRRLGEALKDREARIRRGRAPRLASDVVQTGSPDAVPLLDMLIGDFEARSETEGVSEDLKRLREKVHAKLQRMGGASAVDPATVNDLIKQTIREEQVAGAATRSRGRQASPSSADASGIATNGMDHKIDPAQLWKGRIMYTRIPTGVPSTDPFCGTFLAAFGPHGVEMLQISRATGANGHEVVTARKLTGDPNVPAGQVSFTARVDRAARLDTSEYPDIMGVTGRFPGRGLVANTGFANPHWVDGELLRFADGSPVTQGARLGFVWAAPNQRRFLVLLNRIGLDDEEDSPDS